MKNAFLLIAVLFGISVQAQDCSCPNHFNWVKKTFEENDAGFKFAVDRKGEGAYQKHNETFAEKVKSITDKDTCLYALYDWLKFFRKGHIDIDVVRDNTEKAPAQPANGAKPDWEKYKGTDKQLKKYLAGIKQDGYEGIWKSEPYTIAIVKEGTGYVGFILDGGNTVWQKGQIKIRLTTNGTKMGGVYYLRNYSEYRLEDVQMIGYNTIALGGFTLKRDDPKLQDAPQVKSYLELINTNGPFMQQYSDKTLVLRIRSFEDNNKKAIDSVINANRDKILKTPNLVIDIRYNGGGSDDSYAEIIPFLYTNPIRIVNMQLLSTPHNNKRIEEYLAYEGITEDEKAQVNAMLKKLNDNIGGFVGWNDEKVYVQKLDTIHPFPKNVAILINEGNASTSEQFLLAAKQSTKVKLFGTTTAGILDISNMHSATSPCGVILRYCLSKSLRIPEMAIDDKGIQPDYYLDEEIPQQQWVQYAEDSFEK